MTMMSKRNNVIAFAAIGTIYYFCKYTLPSYLPSCPPASIESKSTPVTSSAQRDDGITVEDLMYKYKSDKSRDDHGYSKLYDMLFFNMRDSVLNMTEIGIAAGQSLQAWYRYFPYAEIHAFDVKNMHEQVKVNMDMLKPRVHPHIVNILDPGVQSMVDLGFVSESMDLIIEDGPHSASSQEAFLIKLFPLVKPGGLYIIEDMGYRPSPGKHNGLIYFRDDPSKLSHEARDILESHDTILVDTATGHRAWGEWVRRVGKAWAANRTYHNSHCMVIRKRKAALRPMQMFYKNGAMTPEHVVHENLTDLASSISSTADGASSLATARAKTAKASPTTTTAGGAPSTSNTVGASPKIYKGGASKTTSTKNASSTISKGGGSNTTAEGDESKTAAVESTSNKT